MVYNRNNITIRGERKKKTNRRTALLKPQAEEGTDVPLNVMDGELILAADVGKIEHHRRTEELVVPLTDDRTAPCNNNLGEVVVKGYAGVAESHRSVAIDDERGQGRYV